MHKKMIHTRYTEPTSRYGAHMGTCHHFPALAEAWYPGGAQVELSGDQYPNLEPQQLVEKAVAILQAVTRQRPAS